MPSPNINHIRDEPFYEMTLMLNLLLVSILTQITESKYRGRGMDWGRMRSKLTSIPNKTYLIIKVVFRTTMLIW